MAENLNAIKLFIISVFGCVGGSIIKVLGGWSEDLTTLLILMGIDFLLGLLIATFWKKSNKSKSGTLNSTSAWLGLLKKGVALLIVLVGYRLDVTLGVDYIKTAVVMAFIVNELISIVENLGIMGVKYPEVIKKAIDVLTSKTDSGDAK